MELDNKTPGGVFKIPKYQQIMNITGQIINFFKEVKQELAKVVFLKREELIKHTINVILISVITAFILGGIDLGFNYLVNKIISSPR